MGCGCGSKSGARKSYVVVLPSGRQKSFAVESNAKAEVDKHPGAYMKAPVPVSA
jgi:hypothetical protein